MTGKFASGIVVAVAMAGLTGCGLIAGTTGSGAITSETREVAAFDRIEANGGIGVTVHVGAAQSVELQTHENLHAIIATDVEAGILKIHSTSSYFATPA